MGNPTWRPVLVAREAEIRTRFTKAMRLAERSYEQHCERMRELRREERRADRARAKLARKARKLKTQRAKWAKGNKAAARLNLVRGPLHNPSAWLAVQLQANPTRNGRGRPYSPSLCEMLAKLKAERMGSEPLPKLTVAPKGAHKIAVRLLRAAGLEV